MAERPRLPADVVEYFLFPETPTFVEDSELEELLCRKHDEYLASLSHLLVGYIWQNEPFRLKSITGDADLPPHLYGRVHFGDNIDDEWFIVYLLLQLTKQFPNLIVRVNDNDGEFLLIEAADVLPKWANPDSAENRVYMYKGEIHLIPIPESPAEITSLPLFISTIREAVDCVRDSPTATRASDQIQAAISNKLSPFPAKVHENLHRSHCYVPAALAAILTTKPSLVAPAVQAFYYRDPLDLKACRTMKYFRPGTRVTAQVTFTRCLYAQLMQQKFTPDQRSGFVLPSQSAPHFKSHDLGMKLAHGFEILCSKCSVGQVNGTNGSNFQSDIRWKRYLKSLTDKGFFRDEIPGSRLHQQLQDSAYKFYKENVINNQSSSSEPGEEILKLLNTVKFDIEDMRRSETSLPPPDDDSWLDLSAEELDEMLMKISGRTEPMADSMNTSNITESMKTFVESVSTHEGAEFPSETGEGEIQFDSTGFIHAMQKMFEFEDDKSDSGSSMSEYGWETDSDDELGSPSLRGPTSRPSSHTSSRITHSSQQAARPATRPAPPSRPPQPNVRPSSKHNVPTGRPSTRPPRPPGPSLPGKQKDGRSIEEYMDMMDRELAQTNVGKSFVRESVPVPKPRRKKQVNGAVPDSRPDIDDEDDDFTPVNIDVNTVKNMLQSYEAQQGLPGPASNILNSMGVRLTESGRTNGQSKYNPFK